MACRAASLRYGPEDPRHGIPEGGEDARRFVSPLAELTNAARLPRHWYASAAEAYRAFTELGRVWEQVGQAQGRQDVAAHGGELLRLAPLLYHDLHASLNKTVVATTSISRRCWAVAADPADAAAAPPAFRGFAELLWSGALASAQSNPGARG